VAEDTATGSAMRILADYWSPRFTSLTAVQCSSEGGLLLAILAPDHVEIGGHCLTVRTLASHA
jgi:predicted PhzF superfamily epimerase YddE/YHI9